MRIAHLFDISRNKRTEQRKKKRRTLGARPKWALFSHVFFLSRPSQQLFTPCITNERSHYCTVPNVDIAWLRMATMRFLSNPFFVLCLSLTLCTYSLFHVQQQRRRLRRQPQMPTTMMTEWCAVHALRVFIICLRVYSIKHYDF